MITIKPTWTEQRVIEMAGIPMSEADNEIIIYTGLALKRCYYLDRAAEELLRILGCAELPT
jgi:hypothetical protein